MCFAWLKQASRKVHTKKNQKDWNESFSNQYKHFTTCCKSKKIHLYRRLCISSKVTHAAKHWGNTALNILHLGPSLHPSVHKNSFIITYEQKTFHSPWEWKILCSTPQFLKNILSWGRKITGSHKHKYHLNFSCSLIYQSVSALLPKYMLSQLSFLRNGDLHWIACLTSSHGFYLTLQSIGQFQTNATKRQRTHRRPPNLTRLPLAGERGSSPASTYSSKMPWHALPLVHLEGDKDCSEQNQAIDLKEKWAIYCHWREK